MAARGGSTRMREWWWLGFDQKLPISPEQWKPYDPNVQYHLTASWNAMLMEDRHEGILLDLAVFTDPPQPYQVWRGDPVEVNNQKEELCGHLAIAGYPKALWELPKQMLPASPASKHGKVIGGFYQVHQDSLQDLEALHRYLSDPNSPSRPPGLRNPRRRVVILIEVERPDFLFANVDRFRKRKAPKPEVAASAVESDSVPPGEAVFQWWWGDPKPGGVGHWKNYHPHVSARLEEELARNEKFRTCQEAVPIDEVRYSLQRISRDAPFDYSGGQGFREAFLPHSRITVGNPLFDDETRLSNNCFVQFQKGNPKRRRPVRRVRRGEVAGLDLKTGDACSVCFSDDGFLIGCGKGHLLCRGCRWMALRTVVGDITQTQNLVCGCLTIADKTALHGLAEAADKALQVLLASPPTDAGEEQEFQLELAQVRRQFQVRDVPPNIFQTKVDDWYENARRKECEHLYHACAYPGCSMDNWILRVDFEDQYRSRGLYSWTCKAGHRNSVLPSQEEINEVNRNILSHPEYYTNRCGYDSLSLRRFRLCPECVQEGLMTFAVHEDGCKQWPGISYAHRHCFCWHCTRKWGEECTHRVVCEDPGLQQVRRTIDGAGGEMLEMGFVPALAYIEWIQTGMSDAERDCPDTVFPSGRVFGWTRQGRLRMEDRDELKRWMDEGTT
ncbi:unnamed protein product [Effrenium voratum]|nr:unnamed protein product [Effrenium voratum]